MKKAPTLIISLSGESAKGSLREYADEISHMIWEKFGLSPKVLVPGPEPFEWVERTLSLKDEEIIIRWGGDNQQDTSRDV